MLAELTKPRLKVGVQIIDDDASLFGTHGAALLRRGAADRVLNRVEHGDLTLSQLDASKNR